MKTILNDWAEEHKLKKTCLKIDPMIVPCFVILLIMLLAITVLQHKQIGECQEAVELLDESNAYQVSVIECLRAENTTLRDSVSFSEQTLNQIDLDYIQTIPEGVDLRIQLVLQALGDEE
jgi:hypothetical protein